MRNDLLPEVRRSAAPALLDADLAAAAAYAERALADSTWRAYRSDLRTFSAWCKERGVIASVPIEAALVAAFLASEAERGRRPVTIERRAAAIAFLHRSRDATNPCDSAAVSTVVSGIRREHGTAPLRQVLALEVDMLESLIAAIVPTTLQGKRDRAIVLLGFGAAMRRSELVALDVRDLKFTAKGLLVTVRSSKTDQVKKGATIAVPYAKARPALCAVRAVTAWLRAGEIRDGAVFRRMRRGDTVSGDRLTAQSVALVVKRAAEAAEVDPTVVAEMAGHSLRAGYITTAAGAGVEEWKIANVSRHRNLPVLREYIRKAQAFENVGEVL